MSQGADPSTNRNNALMILSWRRFRSRDLRTGHHLPFHEAVDFFALQACSRHHDKVFGILGIASSPIRVDYSTSIMELFMASLADYFLSPGFVTEELTPIRRRKELISKLPGRTIYLFHFSLSGWIRLTRSYTWSRARSQNSSYQDGEIFYPKQLLKRVGSGSTGRQRSITIKFLGMIRNSKSDTSHLHACEVLSS